MDQETFFDRQASLRRLTVRLVILATIGSLGVACMGGVASGLAYWQNAQATTGIIDPADLQRFVVIGAAVTVSFTAIAMVAQWLMLRFSISPARRFFHAR